ncbi:MAG TPA: XRE family transcriptional regulator [Nitrospiraceae bacterium]|nr:MAG: hypothetical protein A2Z82_09915 [Nitrospirae bacterium GWA2_46_11]OGW23231.1 MAG: hypothetical protein A2X55_09690 [Nitrospirae bacterium GWB2_47_37]HAK89607.1 XRE family transcriptional regulator [Nitrospiraceae bacterium]HCL82135.1 XRE family transcriptional regulator [Nitrospiraceae bacterium]HCZ10759.1 XRE family transcriptional regulator [Nitrospiraceae bacterium]
MNSKDLLKSLGKKVMMVRKTRKLSQEKLAEMAGLHPTYISNIEQGKVNASIYSYYMIAKALNIQISDLINIPSDKADIKIENEIAVMLSQLRNLGKKKQLIFLSAAKGLLSGIEKI